MPRVSWLFWLLHPIQAYWITFLIKEAYRREPDQSRPDALTWGEKALYVRVQSKIRDAVAAATAKINALAVQQQAALTAAKRERELINRERARLRTPKAKVKTLAGGPITAEVAGTLLAAQQEKVARDTARGDTRHLDRPSRFRRGFAYFMITVDVAAIFNAFAMLYNVDLKAPVPSDLIAVSGFSLIAAGVLGVLAHTTGHAVWESRVTAEAPAGPNEPETPQEATRWPGEVPPRKATLVAKMLGLLVVSVLSGLSILTRVVEEANKIHSPQLGWVLGILVASAAVVAPWLVVLDQMRAGSLEISTIDALTKIVQETDDAIAEHESAAADQQTRADNLHAAAVNVGEQPRNEVAKKAEFVEKVVAKARSLHQRAGRLALLPDAGSSSLGPSPETLGNALTANVSAIDDALRRLSAPWPESEPDPQEPDEKDNPEGYAA